MNLYELANQYNELVNLALEGSEDGQVDEQLAAMLGSLEGDIDKKFASLCRVVRTLEANGDAAKRERDFFAAKAQRANNAVERIKRYISDTLTELGETKRKVDGTFTVAIQKNSQASLVIDDISDVPAKYDKPQERQIYSSLVAEALNRGVVVPGCRLVTGTHVRIK